MSDDQKPGGESFPSPMPLDPEARAAQKRRNLWLGLALFAFVVLVGLTTFVRLKSTDLSKGSFYYGMRSGAGTETERPALPPGMSPDEAAPPPNLADEPATPETEEAPER